MLTSYAITMIRQYTGKLAAYATYCAGGKEHRVPVQSVAMEGDSDVSINVLIAPDGEENVTVPSQYKALRYSIFSIPNQEP